jgi:signal transduction histidine kinase
MRDMVVSSFIQAVAVLLATAFAAEIEPIATVTALTPTALATRPEVTVRGTVIHVDPILRELLVEDDTGGVVVDLGAGGTESAEAIAIGDEVEITGRIGPGEYAPIVSAFRLESHGHRVLPPPRRCDPEAFLAGSDHCRLVEVEGIVQQAWHDGDRVLLEVETAGRLFTAEIPAAVVAAGVLGPDLQALVDAVVVVAGPAKTVSNTRGETLRPWVTVERAEWFTIVSRGVTFKTSAVPLESIGGYRPSFGGGHRIQTFGTVIHAVPGRTLHLQNGHHGVTVRIGAEAEGVEEPFFPGDQVEVAGFIDPSGHVASIRGAAVRKCGHGGQPQPFTVTPESILRVNAASAAGDIQAEPGDYEGCLVRTKGQLIQAQPTVAGGVFVLRSAGTIVNVEADEASFAPFESLAPGTLLEVTGVAAIDWGVSLDSPAGGAPERVRLLVRSADDLRILKAPSWWTTARLLAGLVVTAMILATALGWVASLRRQLAAQQRLLAAEMRSRRDAALEFEATLRERTRLAANLHDTLQQTIGGIGYQLDACLTGGGVTSDETKQHVDVARRMVSYAANEVQGAVWAMRSLSLGGKSLGEALRDLVVRIGAGRDVKINVGVEGAFGDLPEFVAGNLLLIGQEAVHNALRHGAPTKVELVLVDDRGDGRIHLRVTDNGRGFFVGKQRGAGEGHFGLQGMRERTERLGGTFTITSRPGKGTVVEATVERRDYDGQIHGQPDPAGTPPLPSG